jgi:hypothetical protein
MVNEKLGEKVIKLLALPKLRQQSKQYGKPYYRTRWGNKTAEGMGACIHRLLIDTINENKKGGSNGTANRE